jgi:hypothetical protein
MVSPADRPQTLALGRNFGLDDPSVARLMSGP